jgi:hypothetical protein
MDRPRSARKRYMQSPDFRAVDQGNEEDGADFSICDVVTATWRNAASGTRR